MLFNSLKMYTSLLPFPSLMTFTHEMLFPFAKVSLFNWPLRVCKMLKWQV